MARPTQANTLENYLQLIKHVPGLQVLRSVVLRFVPVRRMLRSLQRNLTRIHPPEVRLRNEFNRWAQRGLGDTMESEHMWFAEEALSGMNISSADSVLDLGCGGGFACRLIATRSGELCRVIGIDVSDEMVRYAGRKSSH